MQHMCYLVSKDRKLNIADEQIGKKFRSSVKVSRMLLRLQKYMLLDKDRLVRQDETRYYLYRFQYQM